MIAGNQEHVGSQAVGRALADHFGSFSKKGKSNRWKWCGRGVGVTIQEQQENMVRPFLEEEVQATFNRLMATIG